jgi:hypothetical protein
MDASTVFHSSLGAAVGGFLGVLGFFLVRVAFESWRSKPETVRRYLVGNELNQGQADESEGELMHHHGKRISEAEDYRALAATNPLWEWTRDPVGRGAGGSVIYGPYATDFVEPGLYSVVFRVRGIGFSRPAEITKDLIVLELDVNRTVPAYATTATGPIAFGDQLKISRRFIRVSELAKGGWLDFELRFHSDAQGLWEYRVLAYDGLDGKPDNLARFGPQVRIVFDTVTIRRIKKLNVPT